MKRHETDLECPSCGGLLTLTTERGWDDQHEFTAVLCCQECRTNCGMSDDAVAICHDDDEAAALAGVMGQANGLLDRLSAQDD